MGGQKGEGQREESKWAAINGESKGEGWEGNRGRVKGRWLGRGKQGNGGWVIKKWWVRMVGCMVVDWLGLLVTLTCFIKPPS